jgi:hypothetical protein
MRPAFVDPDAIGAFPDEAFVYLRQRALDRHGRGFLLLDFPLPFGVFTALLLAFLTMRSLFDAQSRGAGFLRFVPSELRRTSLIMVNNRLPGSDRRDDLDFAPASWARGRAVLLSVSPG